MRKLDAGDINYWFDLFDLQLELKKIRKMSKRQLKYDIRFVIYYVLYENELLRLLRVNTLAQVNYGVLGIETLDEWVDDYVMNKEHLHSKVSKYMRFTESQFDTAINKLINESIEDDKGMLRLGFEGKEYFLKTIQELEELQTQKRWNLFVKIALLIQTIVALFSLK